MFSLDRNAPTALADQIELRLRELIASGQLPAAARLLSIRQLAAQLAVSPNTVVTAGYFVREARHTAVPDVVALEAGEEQEGVWLAQQANDQRAGMASRCPPQGLPDLRERIDLPRLPAARRHGAGGRPRLLSDV